MATQNVIKFQTIKLQEFYISSVSNRIGAEEPALTAHSGDELSHRRRLRKMQSNGFLQRAAMKVSELFHGDRVAS